MSVITDQAQAWMDRWLAAPDLRPTNNDGEPVPAEYGFLAAADGTLTFFAQFIPAEGDPFEVTATRMASDLGLNVTPSGDLEPV